MEGRRRGMLKIIGINNYAELKDTEFNKTNLKFINVAS